jgi:hypothetical protein
LFGDDEQRLCGAKLALRDESAGVRACRLLEARFNSFKWFVRSPLWLNSARLCRRLLYPT